MMFPSCHLSKALSVLMEADTLEHFRRRVSLSCAPPGTSMVKAKEGDQGPHSEQPEGAGTAQKGGGEGNRHRTDSSLAIKFDIDLDKAFLLDRMKFQRRFIYTSHSLSLSLLPSFVFPGWRNVKRNREGSGRTTDNRSGADVVKAAEHS